MCGYSLCYQRAMYASPVPPNDRRYANGSDTLQTFRCVMVTTKTGTANANASFGIKITYYFAGRSVLTHLRTVAWLVISLTTRNWPCYSNRTYRHCRAAWAFAPLCSTLLDQLSENFPCIAANMLLLLPVRAMRLITFCTAWTGESKWCVV